jgi:hypothetical protein
MAVYQLTALNILSFSQVTDTNIKWKHIRHTLRLSSTIHESPSVLQVASRLWLQHVAIVSRSVYQLSVSNVLPFTQIVSPRDFIEVAYTPMILVQEVEVESAKASKDIFTLAQSVTVELVKYNSINSIIFAQEVALQIDNTQDIEHTLVFAQGASVYKPSKYFISG